MLDSRTVSLLVAFGLVATHGALAQERNCGLEIRIAEESGELTRLTIRQVVPKRYVAEVKSNPDFLKSRGFDPKVYGNRVFGLPPGEYRIFYELQGGGLSSRDVVVFHGVCHQVAMLLHQRQQLVNDTENDVVMGQVEDCPKGSRELWVKLLPLFRPALDYNPGIFDGLVVDGRFAVPGHFQPGRYAAIIGHGSEIVITVPVTIGRHRGRLDIGTLRVSGCTASRTGQ